MRGRRMIKARETIVRLENHTDGFNWKDEAGLRPFTCQIRATVKRLVPTSLLPRGRIPVPRSGSLSSMVSGLNLP